MEQTPPESQETPEQQESDEPPEQQESQEQATSESPAAKPGRWYPGKLLKEGIQKTREKAAEVNKKREEAKEAGAFEESKHKIVAAKNQVKEKRKLNQRVSNTGQVGKLHVSVLGGSFYTQRPYFILELEGNESRTPTAMTSTPSWEGNPETQFTFPVFDAGADLRVFLFNDESLHNQVAKARVIIPLRDLCAKTFLPMPKAKHQAKFQLMPASRQHSEETKVRYNEAIPGVPGSGMVKPAKNLGEVTLSLHLELTAPGAEHVGLLAAYACAPPGGAVEEEEEDGLEEGDRGNSGTSFTSSPSTKQEEKKAKKPIPTPNPKKVKYNSMRIKRCIGKPYLLDSPWCFSLPIVLYLVCFRFSAYQMPWIFLALTVANGALDYTRRGDHTSGMIFWEDSVGDDQMPKGLEKFKLIFGLLIVVQIATTKIAENLERKRNMLNFADPPVTIVAFALLTVTCFITSLVLLLIPMRYIVFVLGLLALCPVLAKAAGVELPQKKAKSELEDQDDTPASARKPAGRAIKMIKNVMSRVPDDTDVAHWVFCSQQLV